MIACEHPVSGLRTVLALRKNFLNVKRRPATLHFVQHHPLATSVFIIPSNAGRNSAHGSKLPTTPFTGSERLDDRTDTDSPTQEAFKELPKIETSFRSWKEQRHKRTSN
jgi:hypothetical protein